MAKGIKRCKVCGKEYEYCKTWLSQDKFRWQDVACSPECGAKYFALIEASRSASVDNTTKAIDKQIAEVAGEQQHDAAPDAVKAKRSTKGRSAKKKTIPATDNNVD